MPEEETETPNPEEETKTPNPEEGKNDSTRTPETVEV